MACKSCVVRVENVISDTPGAASTSINPATKRAKAVFSGTRDIAAVGQAGYACAVENAAPLSLA